MATLYTRPLGAAPIQLKMPPRLASWNNVGDQERDRLDLYLSHVQELTTSYMTTDVPLALELHVGMGLRTLAHESDLDNYLEPVLRHLGANPILGDERGKTTRGALRPRGRSNYDVRTGATAKSGRGTRRQLREARVASSDRRGVRRRRPS